MDSLYQKLNKKLDALTNQTGTKHDSNKNASKFQSQLINLTNIKFTKEQIQTLSLESHTTQHTTHIHKQAHPQQRKIYTQ